MKEVAISCFDQDLQMIVNPSNGWTGVVDTTNNRLGGRGQQTSPNNGDEFKFTRYFPRGGLYKVTMIYTSYLDHGKMDVGLDANGANNIFSQVDQYSGSAVYNIPISTTIQIARGYHDVHFKANGKNVSSTNYYISFTVIEFDLIQEYATYQDDQPAIGLEGTSVVLAKHRAVQAESTYTFNFSDIDFSKVFKKYSQIRVIIQGRANGQFNLQAIINSLASTYYQAGETNISGTATQINLANQSQLTLLDTTLITGNGAYFYCELVFVINEIIATSVYVANGNWKGGCDIIGNVQGHVRFTPSSPILNSITIQTSSSTWNPGTTITIYGDKQ